MVKVPFNFDFRDWNDSGSLSERLTESPAAAAAFLLASPPLEVSFPFSSPSGFLFSLAI